MTNGTFTVYGLNPSKENDALKVSCPTCSSKPGWSCVSKSTVYPVSRVHATRTRAYQSDESYSVKS